MNYSRRQLYAMGEPLGDSVTRKKASGGLLLGGGGGGGGDVFQDIGNAVSDVGKSVSNAVEDTSKNLTTVLQPIEKAASQAVSDFSEDPSKATTNLLQPVEKTVNYVAAHPEAQLAIALAIAAPYAAAQITPFLTPYLGSYAAMASQAIANVTVAVAQGVPLEKAAEDAVINAAVSGATKEVQQQLNTVISSPGIKNAITSTVSSGLSTAAKGGSQADIEKAMTAGLVGSSASDLYGAAFGVDPNQSTGAKVAQIAAKESALGRTSEQITASILTQFGQKALNDYLKEPSVAAPLDQTAAEDARLARKEAALAGAEKGAYMPDGSFIPTVEEPELADDQAVATASGATPYKPNIVTAVSKAKPTKAKKPSLSTSALGDAAFGVAGTSAYKTAAEEPSSLSSVAPLNIASTFKNKMLPKQLQFQSVLDEFNQLQQSEDPNAVMSALKDEISPEVAMNNLSYTYGKETPIEDILNAQAQGYSLPDADYTADGSGVPEYMKTKVDYTAAAGGAISGTRYGRYARGGLSVPLMASGGKMRVDFRHGDAVTGEGDGQSDDIPAMLADGEFVFPADVVAAIGNGSTKAGSDKLYDMMHGIRAHARSAKPRDLPPEIKSPLDFLKKAKRTKARS
jgi:hypothetical protein